jgi:hypothetical protein
MNGYERLGRVICAALILLAWALMIAFVVGACLGALILLVDWLRGK